MDSDGQKRAQTTVIVIWAIGTCLFLLVFFLLLNNVILGLIYEISREKAALTKTGLNDSIAIVWVLCVFFFFIFLRFFLTYQLFRSFFV